MYLDSMYLKIFAAFGIFLLALAQILLPNAMLALEAVALLAVLTLAFFPAILTPAAVSLPHRKTAL
ncbi:MAG: hypothetical protein ABIP12_05575 [Terriglobales bacterium]